MTQCVAGLFSVGQQQGTILLAAGRPGHFQPCFRRDNLPQSFGIHPLQQRCREQLDLELKITDGVKQYIVDKAYDPKYGARPLRRMIQTKLEDTLADELLSGAIKRGSTVTVRIRKDEIVFC